MATATITEGAVYELPNGERVVASEGSEGGYVLYTLAEWEAFDSADYAADADGCITFQGTFTVWTTDDLRDTGKVV